MSKFPNELDTDADLPRVDDNITEIGAEAINALRDAIFAIEGEIGINASGSMSSIAERISVSLENDGSIKTSAITSLGLVTLPIRNDQIASDAAIEESKLDLNFSTSFLNNAIAILRDNIKIINSFLSISGIKVEPHISGLDYRHELSHIDVDNPGTTPVLSTHILNKNNISRNISNAFEALKDLNTDFVLHQKSDGTTLNSSDASTGTIPPNNFAHVGSGIFIDTSTFTSIGKENNSLQLFAEAVDNNSLLLIGSRMQNLHSNGISRSSRSSTLNLDGYGKNIIPPTLVTTFLLNGSSSIPVDDINAGDDIIKFEPELLDNTFDAKFSQIKPGDIIKIDYGTAVAEFRVESKKYSVNKSGSTVVSKSFYIRINGKNLAATNTGIARVDKPLFNENKYGALALAAANNSNLSPSQTDYPSLILGNPRGANALGIGFDPSKLDETHYNIYLQLYPNGDLTKVVTLPAIDVTGNQGKTPGKYTIETVVEEFNHKVRKNGYNYRFIAYSYMGDFGIMLADPYNNTSFSIISGNINSSTGLYDQIASQTNFPNNIIGISVSGEIDQDALGFGSKGSGLASPPYISSYSTPESAIPTKIMVPLQRNYYYVNGVETEVVNKEVYTSRDSFGDAFWPATIVNREILSDRIETTYQIELDLSTSGLKAGKTLVVQPEESTSSILDFGRFIINSVSFDICDGYIPITTIKVYDGVHGIGTSPYAHSSTSNVRIYFSDDSISFNKENVSDTTETLPYKRFFEILIDQNGHTFTHERARFSISDLSDIAKINILNVSPKLKGYSVSGPIKEINLKIIGYDLLTGEFTALLSRDSSLSSNLGPITLGKKGSVVKLYDETNIDFIEFIFDIDDSITTTTFANKNLTIQLFPTLSLNKELMLLGTCQVDDSTKKIKYLKDKRQFGTVSEEILSTSALDYISAGDKYLQANGIIRGFDLTLLSNKAILSGGLALVNGKLINKDEGFIVIPYLQEIVGSTVYVNIQWAICINDKSEYQIIPLLDYDSLLDVPNNPYRLFKAKNPSNSLTYNLEALTFTDLVDKRKDLTLLYTIVTSVT